MNGSSAGCTPTAGVTNARAVHRVRPAGLRGVPCGLRSVLWVGMRVPLCARNSRESHAHMMRKTAAARWPLSPTMPTRSWPGGGSPTRVKIE
jgi:hypothetical protein